MRRRVVGVSRECCIIGYGLESTDEYRRCRFTAASRSPSGGFAARRCRYVAASRSPSEGSAARRYRLAAASHARSSRSAAHFKRLRSASYTRLFAALSCALPAVVDADDGEGGVTSPSTSGGTLMLGCDQLLASNYRAFFSIGLHAKLTGPRLHFQLTENSN